MYVPITCGDLDGSCQKDLGRGLNHGKTGWIEKPGIRKNDWEDFCTIDKINLSLIYLS